MVLHDAICHSFTFLLHLALDDLNPSTQKLRAIRRTYV